MNVMTRQDINKTTTGNRPAVDTTIGEQVRSSRMPYSRVIGALFLGGYLAYGVGFALVTSVVGASTFSRRSRPPSKPPSSSAPC